MTETQAQDDTLYFDNWIDDISEELDDPCTMYVDYDNPNRNVLAADAGNCFYQAPEQGVIVGGIWIRITGSAGKAMPESVSIF